MDFIPTVDSYADDPPAQQLWSALEAKVGLVDGIAYYKHPVIAATSAVSPDIALLARGFRPHVFLIFRYAIDDLHAIGADRWTAREEEIDSPLLALDDLRIAVNSRMDKVRVLRGKNPALGTLYMPFIGRQDFVEKFGERSIDEVLEDLEGITIVWSDRDLTDCLEESARQLNDQEWRAAQSVFQGVNAINRYSSGSAPSTATTLGDAIRMLDHELALLDIDQHRVATQMAPGPQRIRGLAGTGKTIVLAMKVANIHRRYPDKKVLFTFNTQSLYNQAKKLITRFYREFADEDLNWDNVHIRHGWGGSSRPGVYTEVRRAQNLPPLNLAQAQAINRRDPFAAVCGEALKSPIQPAYDYIIVDEAQDFPKEFFRMLAKLIDPARRTIYFAYDELQSLSALEIPSAAELFGVGNDGRAFVELDGEYPGGIEKDFVLHKSYRCPLDVLLLAHGTGLGIHGPKGCVQMLRSRESWMAVGYEVEAGDFSTGSQMVIYRPPENSPNRIRSLYAGGQRGVVINQYASRDDELVAVADQIRIAIRDEKVPPEQILVICLDSLQAKKYFLSLQRHLIGHEVASSIPGLVNQSWEFAEEGQVTLSTVYRAKGNEAALVFIIATDYLHGYVDEIERRNRAFTAFSRSKAWLRLSGSGEAMGRVSVELQAILADVPRLRFQFPNMDDIRIRKLDAAETTRRRKVVARSKQAMQSLITADIDALREDPELLDKLRRKLSEAERGG
jgi:superfamily I DNA and RNA helicase